MHGQRRELEMDRFEGLLETVDLTLHASGGIEDDGHVHGHGRGHLARKIEANLIVTPAGTRELAVANHAATLDLHHVAVVLGTSHGRGKELGAAIRIGRRLRQDGSRGGFDCHRTVGQAAPLAVERTHQQALVDVGRVHRELVVLPHKGQEAVVFLVVVMPAGFQGRGHERLAQACGLFCDPSGCCRRRARDGFVEIECLLLRLGKRCLGRGRCGCTLCGRYRWRGSDAGWGRGRKTWRWR